MKKSTNMSNPDDDQNNKKENDNTEAVKNQKASISSADCKDKLLTIIVPCYNEEEVLPIFQKSITEVRGQIGINTELLYIDDGSTDGTLQLLRDYSSRDETCHYISFSRNFGKEAGILAGLKRAQGDYCVLLDADMQHPPALLPEMFERLISGGYDSVAMYRKNRHKEGFFRRTFSKLFFKSLSKISKTNIVDGATDFRMMNRPMINSILELGECNRFSKGLFSWIGFNTLWLPFETESRPKGESKWSFRKLISYSIDAYMGFSEVPLKIVSFFGFLFCFIAFIIGFVFFLKTIIWGEPVAGFPTLICMLMLIGGLLMLFLGIIGQYLSRIYIEVKKRPVYLVKETEQDSKTLS